MWFSVQQLDLCSWYTANRSVEAIAYARVHISCVKALKVWVERHKTLTTKKKDKQANKQNWFWWSDWVFIEDKDNSITPSRGPVWKIWSIINDACDGRREILSVLLDVTQRSLKTAAKIWAGVLTLIVQYFKTKCHFHIKLNGLSFIELYHLSDCYRQIFISIE